MILTVDIGNTTIALTALGHTADGYYVLFSEKLPSDRKTYEFYAPVKQLLDGRGISFAEIEGIVLSSVVPDLTMPMCRAIEGVTGKSTVVISAKDCKTLRFAVPELERLGLDRVADSAWAAAHYTLPAVTVDMGTATTFNVIGKDGEFLGGMIAAGMQTSLNALSERTAQLPKLELSAPERLIGRNTTECMISGAIIGAAAMVDGIVSRVESKLKSPVTLILTGGGAEFVEPFLLHSHVFEPYLLAKGLAFIYENEN